MKFNITFRPYPAGAGSRVHDELWTIEGPSLRFALDEFYQKPEFNPEWRVVNIECNEQPEWTYNESANCLYCAGTGCTDCDGTGKAKVRRIKGSG